MNTRVAAPSLENMDGIACGAIGDFAVAEPFTHVGTEIAVADQSEFYTIAVFNGDAPLISGAAVGQQRYMLVELAKRDMMLDKRNNRMVVCRDRS